MNQFGQPPGGGGFGQPPGGGGFGQPPGGGGFGQPPGGGGFGQPPGGGGFGPPPGGGGFGPPPGGGGFGPPPGGGGFEPSAPTTQPEIEPMAIASVCLGLLSLLICCCFAWCSPIPALAAIVLGALSLRKIQREPARFKGKELAITGIVIGSLCLLILLGMMGLYLFGVLSNANVPQLNNII